MVCSLSIAGAESLLSDFADESSSTYHYHHVIDDQMQWRKFSYDTQQLRSRLPPQLNLDEQALANKRIKRKLPPLARNATESTVQYDAAKPLPKTINDISKLDKDTRAIVVTEMKDPYRITAVNTAWESLCGYKRGECVGHSLGYLLQGPETEKSTVRAMLSKLLAGEEAGAVLTNYTRHGRKFQNHIRVRPIVNEMGKTVHFVGVLHEVKQDNEVHFGNEEGDGERKQLLPFMA